MGSNSQKAAFIKDPNHPSFASKSNLYFIIYKIQKKKIFILENRYGKFNFPVGRQATDFWMVGLGTPPKLFRRHSDASGLWIAMW